MRSIDMAIHLIDGHTVLYERLRAKTNQGLAHLLTATTEKWGREGVWSDWEAGHGGKRAFYPPTAIRKIVQCSDEPFGIEEVS